MDLDDKVCVDTAQVSESICNGLLVTMFFLGPVVSVYKTY